MNKLISNEWLENAKKQHRERQAEKIKERNGAKCETCKHMREHLYTKKIVYCSLGKFKVTKRNDWCMKYEKRQ